VQPYLDGVDVDGETALIYIAGEFSHAVRKSAMLAPSSVNELDPGYSRSLYIDERITATTPSPTERALGDQVMAGIATRFGRLLYARVDLLPTSDGPVLIELELTEPSLFLSHDEDAADRLAAAITALLSSSA
jgi:hypothetical protein